MIADKLEEGDVEETVAAALDADFYLRSHPELDVPGADPVKHYLAEGHARGLWPTPEFDTRFYLSRSPDVAAAGLNGFFHYLRWGRVEGRAPNAAALEVAAEPTTGPERLVRAHVDEAFYFAQRPEVGDTHVAAYKHYLHFGWHGDLDPGPGFSTRFYRSTPYDTDAHENPLHHFVRLGRMRGRLPRPLLGPGVDMHGGPAVEAALRPRFDADFYRAAYPDARLGDGDPLADYLQRGWREGRDPTPWFSTAEYRARFPDAETLANPFLHYLLWGREQGFPPAAGPDGARTAVQDPAAPVASAELRPIARRGAPPERSPETEGGALDPARLDLHWIIPDVQGPGRGGHMTLFRLVRWLEAFGHRCTVWVNDPHPDWTDEARRELIQRSYQAIAAEVRVLPESPRFAPEAVVVATSWTTALVLNATPSARRRFYLVQDDERSFHPAGSAALAAERTYDLDMGYLCAGSWLAETLARTRGRWTRAFDLAPDARQHPPAARPVRTRSRIAFYARRLTDRRAVELGLLALQRLAETGADFEVHLFGSDAPLDAAPFPAIDHGVVEPESLAELYRDCDIGLCFSATNASLIPQEMMACGLPVVELDAPGTRAVFPPDVVTLAGPDPESIADALGRLLDAPTRQAQAERALAWVSGRSWERSGRAVEAAIVERLSERGAKLRPRTAPDATAAPLASVVIPTLNGGAAFRRVLDQVLAQRTPWPFEIVVVDSGSDDGTWEMVRDHPSIRALSIPRATFQHGRTRNLAAEETRGEFIAFLTQDAEPADPLWLADLVGALQRRPRAAGAFGRHLPRPDASPFTKRDLHGFFRHLGAQPLERSKFLDLARWRSGDVAFRRELHFFSNNNGCLRRSVWRRLPLPETEYGEDQLWATTVLGERYSLVYAPTACVLHSHDYDEASRFERSRVEGRWFRDQFGYDVVPPEPQALIARMNAGDERWGVRNAVARAIIEHKKRLNAAEVEGLVAGQLEL